MNTFLFFLVPCQQGVRSRRHRIVLRRAESHLLDIVIFLDPLGHQEKKPLNKQQQEWLNTKVMLIEQAVDELERYATWHPRTRIGPRLEMTKGRLVMVQRFLLVQQLRSEEAE